MCTSSTVWKRGMNLLSQVSSVTVALIEHLVFSHCLVLTCNKYNRNLWTSTKIFDFCAPLHLAKVKVFLKVMARCGTLFILWIAVCTVSRQCGATWLQGLLHFSAQLLYVRKVPKSSSHVLIYYCQKGWATPFLWLQHMFCVFLTTLLCLSIGKRKTSNRISQETHIGGCFSNWKIHIEKTRYLILLK